MPGWPRRFGLARARVCVPRASAFQLDYLEVDFLCDREGRSAPASRAARPLSGHGRKRLGSRRRIYRRCHRAAVGGAADPRFSGLASSRARRRIPLPVCIRRTMAPQSGDAAARRQAINRRFLRTIPTSSKNESGSYCQWEKSFPLMSRSAGSSAIFLTQTWYPANTTLTSGDRVSSQVSNASFGSNLLCASLRDHK